MYLQRIRKTKNQWVKFLFSSTHPLKKCLQLIGNQKLQPYTTLLTCFKISKKRLALSQSHVPTARAVKIHIFPLQSVDFVLKILSQHAICIVNMTLPISQQVSKSANL